MKRADHLGVEGQPDGVAVDVGEAAAGARRRGGHHVVHRAEPLAEGGDGGLVGEVDGLGADAGLAVVGGAERLGCGLAATIRAPSSRAARAMARASPLPRPMISTVWSFSDRVIWQPSCC